MTEYVNIWEIQASLSGPCHHEKIDDRILPMKSEGTLVRKYQKCGKKCRTCIEGKGHGPYDWRVQYNKETKSQVWKYIGKNGVGKNV